MISILSVKEHSKKDCDDEDECGSADDVFTNVGSGDEFVKDKVCIFIIYRPGARGICCDIARSDENISLK